MKVTLDALWKDPERAGEIIREFRAEKEDLYRLEKMLESEVENN